MVARLRIFKRIVHPQNGVAIEIGRECAKSSGHPILRPHRPLKEHVLVYVMGTLVIAKRPHILLFGHLINQAEVWVRLGPHHRAGVNVRLGITVTSIQQEPGRVEVAFSNGRNDSFDLLAGFDGIRSAIRLHLVGTAFAPRFSGYGAWRVQAARPDYVCGMEFLQGVGSKTGAMPLSNDTMYLFHICPEAASADFAAQDHARLLTQRLAQYGSYVAQIAATLNGDSDIVYSPIEPLLLPWPWFRGRVVIGGDAAHVFAPHLTQGAAMAAEDAFVLAREVLNDDCDVQTRLMRYTMQRYPRCAFVYTFSGQWLQDEQSVRSTEELERARKELSLNASARIGVSDRILNEPI